MPPRPTIADVPRCEFTLQRAPDRLHRVTDLDRAPEPAMRAVGKDFRVFAVARQPA